MEIDLGEPLRQGVKRNRVAKCHVRVSHLLMSLWLTLLLTLVFYYQR